MSKIGVEKSRNLNRQCMLPFCALLSIIRSLSVVINMAAVCGKSIKYALESSTYLQWQRWNQHVCNQDKCYFSVNIHAKVILLKTTDESMFTLCTFSGQLQSLVPFLFRERGGGGGGRRRERDGRRQRHIPVSYTHLTLPTRRGV